MSRELKEASRELRDARKRYLAAMERMERILYRKDWPTLLRRQAT